MMGCKPSRLRIQADCSAGVNCSVEDSRVGAQIVIFKEPRNALVPDASAFQHRTPPVPAPRHEEQLRLEGRLRLRAPLY